MRRFFISLGVALALLVPTISTVTATPAEAGTPTRAHLARLAKQVATERVYGSFYQKAKKRHPKALNWSTDGCSVPRLVPGQGKWKTFFRSSCVRHDFGYRNKMRTGLSKGRVDNVFKSNMYYQCNNPKRKRPGTVKQCKKAADRFYWAVDKFGKY